MESGVGLLLVYDALVVIQSKLFEVELGNTDLAVWNAKHGQYTCVDAWDKLREVCPTVGWWKLVWFPSSIPKHSFFFFLYFCGLSSRMHWSLRIECADGVTLDALCVYSVVVPKRTENTFSLGVASIVEFGQISWSSVPFQMLFWIGILLKLGD